MEILYQQVALDSIIRTNIILKKKELVNTRTKYC
jgi:hypothetical protein